jgi:hypothetical protein
MAALLLKVLHLLHSNLRQIMTNPVRGSCEVRYLENRFGKKYGWPDNDDVYTVNIKQLVKVNLNELQVGKRTVYTIPDAELNRANSKLLQ